MNTHFCLIWLFKLERQGRIILKIQISLGSILNLPQIEKILAIWAHKLNTPWFSLLPRKRQPNADTNYMEMQRPSCIWRGQCTPHSFTWSEAKECDQGLRLLPYLMLIEFFFLFLVRILFQGNDYLNFFFFFFPWASWNKNKSDLMALGALWKTVQATWCVCGRRVKPVVFQPTPRCSVYTAGAGWFPQWCGPSEDCAV